MRRFLSGLKVADSLLVFHYLPVCEIEDESVYNGNFIQYKYNFISINYSVKAEKTTYFTANKPFLKNRSSMHAFVTVEIKLKIESQWS